jgi:hypothetical protein
MCDGEADDVDSICELYAAEAHRSAPLRTTISVNLREQLRGAGAARAVSSRTWRHQYVRQKAAGLTSDSPFPALPSFFVLLEVPELSR